MATGKARSSTVDSRVRRTVSDDEKVEQLFPGLESGRALELIGEVRRCRPVQTLVHENSELELDPLWGCQQMQLPKEWSDVVEPRRRKHKPRGRVHDRLKLLRKVRRNASQVALP